MPCNNWEVACAIGDLVILLITSACLFLFCARAMGREIACCGMPCKLVLFGFFALIVHATLWRLHVNLDSLVAPSARAFGACNFGVIACCGIPCKPGLFGLWQSMQRVGGCMLVWKAWSPGRLVLFCVELAVLRVAQKLAYLLCRISFVYLADDGCQC